MVVLWHARNAEEEGVSYASRLQGFRDLGHVAGRTLVFEQIFAAEQYERFNENAAALVAHNADVLVVVTRSGTIAAQRATVTIPIVFTIVRRNIEEAQKVAKTQHSCGAESQPQRGPLFDRQLDPKAPS